MSVLIGHSSPSFCHDSAQATLDRCADAGFGVWEVVGDGRHFLPEIDAALAERARKRGIKLQLHAPIGDVNLGSLNPRMWELSVATVEDSLRAAAGLGIRRVTLHPGNHSPLSRGHYTKVHEATRRALKRLDPLGRELGLELNLENMPSSWAFETIKPRQLVDLTDGLEYGFTLDLGHAHVAKTMDDWLENLDGVRNVHVHDNQGAVDDHLTLDEGSVPWRRALDALREAGYQGTYVIESRSHESGAASLARLREHLSGRAKVQTR